METFKGVLFLIAVLTSLACTVLLFRAYVSSRQRVLFWSALCFALMAMNQLAVFALGAGDERGNYAYILRVLGFVLILVAIVDKNVFARRRVQ